MCLRTAITTPCGLQMYRGRQLPRGELLSLCPTVSTGHLALPVPRTRGGTSALTISLCLSRESDGERTCTFVCVCKGEFVSVQVYTGVLFLGFWDLVVHIPPTPWGEAPSLGWGFGASLVALSLCRLSVLLSLFTLFKPQFLGPVRCRWGCHGELYPVFVTLGGIPASACGCGRRRDFLFP